MPTFHARFQMNQKILRGVAIMPPPSSTPGWVKFSVIIILIKFIILYIILAIALNMSELYEAMDQGFKIDSVAYSIFHLRNCRECFLLFYIL